LSIALTTPQQPAIQDISVFDYLCAIMLGFGVLLDELLDLAEGLLID